LVAHATELPLWRREGGDRHRPQAAVGDHPSCTSEARKDGETADCARSSCEGLGLDGEGGRRPQNKKRESQPTWAGIRSAQGMEAYLYEFWSSIFLANSA